jgi:hypothetical protein
VPVRDIRVTELRGSTAADSGLGTQWGHELAANGGTGESSGVPGRTYDRCGDDRCNDCRLASRSSVQSGRQIAAREGIPGTHRIDDGRCSRWLVVDASTLVNPPTPSGTSLDDNLAAAGNGGGSRDRDRFVNPQKYGSLIPTDHQQVDSMQRPNDRPSHSLRTAKLRPQVHVHYEGDIVSRSVCD